MAARLDISSQVWGCGFRAWITPNLVVKVILPNSLVACMKSWKDAWGLGGNTMMLFLISILVMKLSVSWLFVKF